MYVKCLFLPTRQGRHGWQGPQGLGLGLAWILGFNTLLLETTGQKSLGRNIGPCLSQIRRGAPARGGWGCQNWVKFGRRSC